MRSDIYNPSSLRLHKALMSTEYPLKPRPSNLELPIGGKSSGLFMPPGDLLFMGFYSGEFKWEENELQSKIIPRDTITPRSFLQT